MSMQRAAERCMWWYGHNSKIMIVLRQKKKIYTKKEGKTKISPSHLENQLSLIMRLTLPHKDVTVWAQDRHQGHTEWRQFPKQVFEITVSTQSLIFILSALNLHLPFIWVFSADRVSFLSVLSDPWRLRGTSQFDWLVLFTVMHCLVSAPVEIPNPLPESLGGRPDSDSIL